MLKNFKSISVFVCAGVIAVAGFVATSCKKDDGDPAVPGTIEEIEKKLVGDSAKKWLPVKIYKTNAQLGFDELTDACYDDDTLTLTANTGRATTGNTACTGEEKNAYLGVLWSVSLTSNIATATITGGNYNINGIITQLNNNTLKVEMTGGDAKKVTAELKAVN